MYDPAAKKLVWIGAAQHAIEPSKKQEKNQERLNKGAQKLRSVLEVSLATRFSWGLPTWDFDKCHVNRKELIALTISRKERKWN